MIGDVAWFAAGVVAGAVLVVQRLPPVVVRLYVRAALRRNPWDARLVEELLRCVLVCHVEHGQLDPETRILVRTALHALEPSEVTHPRV